METHCLANPVVCGAYKCFKHGSSKGAELIVLHVKCSSEENDCAEQK